MDADGGWSGFETTLEPLEAYMKKVWWSGAPTGGQVPPLVVRCPH